MEAVEQQSGATFLRRSAATETETFETEFGENKLTFCTHE